MLLQFFWNAYKLLKLIRCTSSTTWHLENQIQSSQMVPTKLVRNQYIMSTLKSFLWFLAPTGSGKLYELLCHRGVGVGGGGAEPIHIFLQ